jgi:hypothetical protein
MGSTFCHFRIGNRTHCATNVAFWGPLSRTSLVSVFVAEWKSIECRVSEDLWAVGLTYSVKARLYKVFVISLLVKTVFAVSALCHAFGHLEPPVSVGLLERCMLSFIGWVAPHPRLEMQKIKWTYLRLTTRPIYVATQTPVG